MVPGPMPPPVAAYSVFRRKFSTAARLENVDRRLSDNQSRKKRTFNGNRKSDVYAPVSEPL